MKIFLLGSEGQLGSSIKKKLTKKIKLFTFTRTELDITDSSKISKLINKYQPDIIINAAAYTNVDAAEENIKESYNINSNCLIDIAKLCSVNNIMLIHFSTDYVYDGEIKGYYKELDKTNPLSIYGKSKLQGEFNIINNTNNYIILRVNWLFGNHQNSFINKICKLGMIKENLNIIDDQYGIPTYTDELANFIGLYINEYKNKNHIKGIYHFTGNGDVSSWYDIVKFISEYFEKNSIKFAKISKISTVDYNAIASRPANSKLNIDKIKKKISFNQLNWKIHVTGILEIIRSKL